MKEINWPVGEPIIIEPEELHGLKLFVLCSIIAIISAGLALLVAGSNVVPNLIMTDSYCDALIENSSNMAYTQGIIDTSQFTIQTGQLPVFVNESGNVTMDYINLTLMING